MQDLSDNEYAKHSLAAGSSMSAGNTVSDSAEWAMGAPGSESVNKTPPEQNLDDPMPELGTTQKANTGIKRITSSYKPSALTWKKTK